jgi:hypothetical protein
MTEMSASDDESRLWFGVAAVTLIAVAAALRARLGASLFEDEVWVAELVRRGGMRPHTYSTPLLFYAIERAWVALRGGAVEILRQPPALFGVAAMALPFAAMRFDRLTRFAWGALLAFSSPLLFYSTRLKQYTIEASFCALLIVLFINAQESERGRDWFLFFLVAAGAVLTLFAPLFIVATAALLTLVTPVARRGRILLGFAFVAALFALAWFGWMAPGPETPRLHGDMNAFFATNGRWVDSPASLVGNTKHWLGHAFNLVPFWWVVLTVFAILAVVLPGLPGMRKVMIVAFAIVPPALVALASARHLYPYGEVRLMIFCFPGLYLLIAASVAAVARPAGLALLLLFGVPYVFNGVAKDAYNRSYMHIDDLTPLFANIAANHLSGEPIYAESSYAAPLKFHHPELAADVREPAPGAGWHIGARVDTAGAKSVLRAGDVTAARF